VLLIGYTWFIWLSLVAGVLVGNKLVRIEDVVFWHVCDDDCKSFFFFLIYWMIQLVDTVSRTNLMF
jgi:hypothetical protein